MIKFVLAFITGLILTFNGGSNAFAQSEQKTTQAEANRALVLEFYDTFFNKHNVDEAAKVVTDDYKQHNPFVPDGKEPFVSYFREFFKENPQSKARVIRSAVDGDLVWLHVHSASNPQDPGEAVVDIFRVQDNKIVEHWDAVQAVPETSANNNTMF